MFHLFKRIKPSVESIIACIHEIDSMPHADIYSRWEADKQILQHTINQLIKEIGNGTE